MELKKDLIFEDCVGIGATCYTRMQINMFFNPGNLSYYKTKKGHSNLFDWLIIKDYDKFADALDNNLEDFFNIEDMEISDNVSHLGHVYNKKYDMNWKHLFDSLIDYGGHLLWSHKNGRQLTMDDFKVFYEEKTPPLLIGIYAACFLCKRSSKESIGDWKRRPGGGR